MKKITITIAALLVSASAWAMHPITNPGEGELGREGRMQKCLDEGMTAAELTEEQKSQIHENMMAAMQVKEEHKNAIQEAKQSIVQAWSQHPIVRADVIAAEENMKTHKAPVKAAMRDSMIDSLNLLSGDQRQKFDAAFVVCIHEKQHD